MPWGRRRSTSVCLERTLARAMERRAGMVSTSGPGLAAHSLASLGDLPDELLENIFGSLQDDYRNLLALATTSRTMARVASKFVACANVLRGDDKDPSIVVFERLKRRLKLLVDRFPRTASLRVEDLPITGELLEDAVLGLPELRSLSLVRAQRISSASISRVCERGNLSTLSLQRCYQMQWTVLASAIAVGVDTLAVSHITMPDNCPPRFLPTSGSSGSIRRLGLTNCRLSMASLIRLLRHTPHLEYLGLGGSLDDGEQIEDGLAADDGDGDGATVASLARLAVLERTFVPEATLARLRRLITLPPEVTLLDLASEGGVRKAHAMAFGEGGGDLRALIAGAVGCSSRQRRQPLHCASLAGDGDRVQRLLAMGADAHARDGGGNTPLFLAAERGQIRPAQILLAANADVASRNAKEETPLYIAALMNRKQLVGLLLEAAGARGLDWTDPAIYGDGWTVLMAAVVGNHTGLVLELLARVAGDAGDAGGGGGRGRGGPGLAACSQPLRADGVAHCCSAQQPGHRAGADRCRGRSAHPRRVQRDGHQGGQAQRVQGGARDARGGDVEEGRAGGREGGREGGAEEGCGGGIVNREHACVVCVTSIDRLRREKREGELAGEEDECEKPEVEEGALVPLLGHTRLVPVEVGQASGDVHRARDRRRDGRLDA